LLITIALVLATGLVSLLLTRRVRAYAVRNDVLDHPNERSSHGAPTPRGGGLAVLLAALLALAAGVAVHRIDVQHALALAPGICVLGLVGWLDDHGGLSARTRLATHVVAAVSCLVVLGGLPDVQVGRGSLHLGIAGSLLATLALVWSTNLFNFMDGIDGIAGSQAVLVFGGSGALFLLRGDRSLGTMALAFAAAAAGFLYWNWPPARIFMGDVASGALGFMIAALAVAGERRHSIPLMAFVLLNGVFIADATVTLLRRLSRGARPADAHRDHAYQRLTRAWGAHRPVTLGAAAITLVLGGLAAVVTLCPVLALPAIVAGAMLLAIVILAAERRAPM
jgi:Fuc2NAc and GlcNAc transferase